MSRRPTRLLSLAVFVLTVAGCGSGAAAPVAAPSSASGPSATAGEWRTEYWHDVAVDVPADWWYGGGLMPASDGSGPLACYPEPIVDPVGGRSRGSGSASGWVGRPIGLSDVCADPTAGGPPPEQPYLWFDAPLDPGTEQLGDGWTRETHEVNGSLVTVATDDDRLRDRILATATGGERCFADLDALADVGARVPTTGDGTTVCTYRQEGDRVWLTYAAPLASARAEEFVEAFAAAEPFRPMGRECDVIFADSDWAVLDIAGTTYVVRFRARGCPVVSDGRRAVELTPRLVEPWATGGIPAVVVGPTGGKGAMLESFIGVQG